MSRLFETIAQESTFGIVVFDTAGDSVFINLAAQTMLGGEPKRRLEDLVPVQEHAHFKSFSRDLLRHAGFYQDILVQKDAKSTFVAQIGVRPIESEEVTGWILMLQDVTQQKKLQREIIANQTEIKLAHEELIKQNRQLKDLDLAKNRFIALTTHELRTPLSAMVASAEILKLGLYDNAEQMREFIEMIYDQGLHLQDLVNDILDFAKIQAGKMDFFIEAQDVTELVRAVATHFSGMAETNRLTIELSPPTEPLTCYYDDVRLRQVLSNIISNAIKYNRPGGHVTISFREDDTCVRVSVGDSGKGIPPEQFGAVFNEFETIGQVALHHKGTGLGMPISRKLAEGMGGKLDFASEVGRGSTFWVEIPKARVLPDEVYRPRLVA